MAGNDTGMVRCNAAEVCSGTGLTMCPDILVPVIWTVGETCDPDLLCRTLVKDAKKTDFPTYHGTVVSSDVTCDVGSLTDDVNVDCAGVVSGVGTGGTIGTEKIRVMSSELGLWCALFPHTLSMTTNTSLG